MNNRIDENMSQCPFYPTEIKAIKDVAALKEALSMFQSLQKSEATLQNPSMMSKFSPSPLLILSIQRLLHKEEEEEEQSNLQHDEKNIVDSTTEALLTNDDRVVNEYTPPLPRLVIQQRNSRGGRARLSSYYSNGTNLPCSNAAATVTPRIHSRRRRKCISTKSQKLVSAWSQCTNASTKNDQRGRRGLQNGHFTPNLGIGLDSQNSPQNQLPKENDQDDFAFHSQSSLPTMND
mmetsp:Transcript_16212/g.30655  ORF Transcript_16212/g.30655 Transcript_16212/m.30655 type:complete len:234 (-) Transcript_16212:76-777(-)